ncbi:lipopolysaccharide-induced tumor necrosis factor-alpha factor homolog [Cebidichthys violaceus]|uniref:lipopolysaccharide-induced tumor necrosis factor-alpha factor homolog n=1 Tax=Cebidichthys violaceus TaxID=271503 RepID=UPI0035C94A0A
MWHLLTDLETQLGDGPVQVACPKCRQTVVSKVDCSSGLLTCLSCGGLFFCGYEGLATVLSSFVLGCCLIPFCVDRLKYAKHSCPACNTVLAVYKRL